MATKLMKRERARARPRATTWRRLVMEPMNSSLELGRREN